MSERDDLSFFTSRFERGELSREAYRKALAELVKTADQSTCTAIKRRLEHPKT